MRAAGDAGKVTKHGSVLYDSFHRTRDDAALQLCFEINWEARTCTKRNKVKPNFTTVDEDGTHPFIYSAAGDNHTLAGISPAEATRLMRETAIVQPCPRMRTGGRSAATRMSSCPW